MQFDELEGQLIQQLAQESPALARLAENEDALARMRSDARTVWEADPNLLFKTLRRLAEEASLMERDPRAAAPNILTVEYDRFRLDTLLDGTYRVKINKRTRMWAMLLLNQHSKLTPTCSAKFS